VRKLRLWLLAGMLLGVSLWALAVEKRRNDRTRWHKSLEVAVVLLSQDGDPDPAEWRAGLDELQRWLSAEMARYRPVLDDPPVRFSVHGPLHVDAPPRFLPDDDGAWTRVTHAWRLSRELAALDARAHVRSSPVRLYVFLEKSAAPPSVEGAGEVGGDAGFVRATFQPDLTMALTATAHELFHCLGAQDKYDEAGHARAPDGWVEPERGALQRFAELMVGEVPEGPRKGRLPRSLDEVRVGAATAAEVGWRLTPTGR
jgi:hypothetical protein